MLILRRSRLELVSVYARFDHLLQFKCSQLVFEELGFLHRFFKPFLEVSSVHVLAEERLRVAYCVKLALLRTNYWNLMDQAVDKMLHKVWVDLNRVHKLELSDILGHS